MNSNIAGIYTKKNNDNNKKSYLEELNQFKNQMNLRFKNFRDYIMDKKRDIFNEENKSRNFEEPEKYDEQIQDYGYKKYLLNNNQRKYNFLLNNNHAHNYLERTNLQNRINDYRNKYNAFENSINKNNNNKPVLRRSLSEDKIIFNSNNNFNRYFKAYNNNN